MNPAASQVVPLGTRIDEYCDRVGNDVRARMARLQDFSEDRLERIMFEGWQVSVHNPPILFAAAESARQLGEPGVYVELMRNYREEETHSELYRRGLLDIGSDVSRRTPWAPSDTLFACVNRLIAAGPSQMLGSMYASEAVALFESDLLMAVAAETIRRRNAQEKGRRLIAFHAMHLGGVEQGHKNGLAEFLEPRPVASGLPIDPQKVWEGATVTIDAIGAWWNALLDPAAPVKEGLRAP